MTEEKKIKVATFLADCCARSCRCYFGYTAQKCCPLPYHPCADTTPQQWLDWMESEEAHKPQEAGNDEASYG